MDQISVTRVSKGRVIPEDMTDTVTRDSKGRVIPEDMTDTELLIEIVSTMRQIADALEGMGKNPMLRSMFGNVKIG